LGFITGKLGLHLLRLLLNFGLHQNFITYKCMMLDEYNA
jgi:hypothetical protein